MNEPLIDSSNAKVKTHSSSHCLSITWEGIRLNIPPTDKLILNHCRTCMNFKGYYLTHIKCSKQSLIGEGYLGNLLKIIDGKVNCEYYSKKVEGEK